MTDTDIVLTRKEKEKLMHKEAILKAALCLFSGKGFHNVSMQDIAVEAEFSVGTLYNFFESKEQLFTELLNDCAERIYEMLWPILAGDGREDEILREFIRAHSRLAEENIDFIKLYVSEQGNLTAVHNIGDVRADELKTILRDKMEEIIEAGIKKKIFRCVDAKTAAHSLTAALQSFILESSENFEKKKIEEGLTKIEQLFADCLLMPEK
jgi:AcrR family transcriptional regulator